MRAGAAIALGCRLHTNTRLYKAPSIGWKDRASTTIDVDKGESVNGLTIAFGIVFPLVLSYTFVGSLTFRVLKKLGIGVSHLADGDWAYGTVWISIFWPVTIPPLVMYRSSKVVFELIESYMEDTDKD